MSLAEEMLATMPLSDDSSTYSADEEPHIVINESRQAIVPNELKTIAVTGDKDIETVTFDCVRYWDGNDLSTFAIYLNYVLPDLTTGTYIPEKITTTDGDEFYHFDWKIKNNITANSGKISFAVTAISTKPNSEGIHILDKKWSSLPNSDCSIALGLNIANVPDTEETEDILAQMSAILEQIHANVDEWIKTALVQETGDSEEKAMGQKATTIAIEDAKSHSRSYTDDRSAELNADIQKNYQNIQKNYQIAIRNSKQIENLKSGISEQFELDSLLAYAKDVPANALPYAEIAKVGGMTYKDGNTLRSAKVTEVKSVGVNLFDGEVLEGYYNVDNGSYVYNEKQYCTKNFIPVLPITQYFVSKASNYVLFYDSNKNFLSSQYYAASVQFAAPERAAYMLVNFGNVEKNNIMINAGATALPYTPYVKHILPIPEAVQALEGYGQGNPDDPAEYNAIIWGEHGTNQYLQKGNIVDVVWYALSTPEVTDISDLLPADNLISVEGGGTLTFENEYGYAVPSEVEYQVEV